MPELFAKRAFPEIPVTSLSLPKLHLESRQSGYHEGYRYSIREDLISEDVPPLLSDFKERWMSTETKARKFVMVSKKSDTGQRNRCGSSKDCS